MVDSESSAGLSGSSGVAPAVLPCAYGEWPSPITAKIISEESTRVEAVLPDGDNLWWSEYRPTEGRSVLMRLNTCNPSAPRQSPALQSPDMQIQEVTPEDANVNTRVHEYGGMAWWAHEGVCYYSDDSDGCLRKLQVGDQPQLLTSQQEGFADRWADFRLTPDGHWLICVRERHRQHQTQSVPPSPANEIVAVATDGSCRTAVLVRQQDFCSNPRISQDGNKLAWLSWNLPDMPWDSTCLWVGELCLPEAGSTELPAIQKIQLLRGRNTTPLVAPLVARQPDSQLPPDSQQSPDSQQPPAPQPPEWIFQPEWHDNNLVFVSDCNDWSTLWQVSFAAEFSATSNLSATAPRQLLEYTDAEIQIPPWSLGESRYAHADTGLVWAMTSNGADQLHFGTGVTFHDCSAISEVRAWKQGVVALVGYWDRNPEIVYFKKDGGNVRKEIIGTNKITRALTSPHDSNPSSGPSNPSSPPGASPPSANSFVAESTFAPEFFPAPESFSFESAGQTAHALYFAPAHPKFTGPPDMKPPLVVIAHGGPTAAARSELSLKTRYWTSRGFGVVDVNYRGSTGYGRQYRQLLYGQWGIADTQDCISAARHLCDQGKVDPAKLAIKGSSAGGFTVLCALAFSDIFTAGVSSYGVADLEALAKDTHKFESRYLDQLVGPYPAERAKYQVRSPINHIDKLSCAMLVLQGMLDKVVPPNQAEQIVGALSKRKLPHAYVIFPEEGHGFRLAGSQVKALESELSFFAQVFGFHPADADDPDFTKLELSFAR